MPEPSRLFVFLECSVLQCVKHDGHSGEGHSDVAFSAVPSGCEVCAHRPTHAHTLLFAEYSRFTSSVVES